jgi:Zn-dependent peptidase ImmA (M78 family)/transcriptional regulator with XRE-family HTH domain
MQPEINYRMITLARESRGYTQKDLAEKIPSLNQGNLSKIERGQLSISQECIEAISAFLKYPIEFFYQKDVSTPVSAFYYRKRASVTKRTLAKFEAQINVVRLGLDKLLREVDIEDFQFPKLEVDVHNTPQEAARVVRAYLKVPKGPIRDLITTLENCGIIIYFIEVEEDGIDGFTAFTDLGRPVMFINQSYPNDRKRFTIAHELGHLVMHIPFILESWRDEELEANQFASEFLMPEIECRADFAKFKFSSLDELKSYWGISKAAIIRRAFDLSIIPRETYTYMIIELGRRGERKKEKGYVSLDEPKLLKEVLNIFLNELKYTKQDLAKIVCLNEKDLEDNFIEMGKRKFKVTLGNQAA